MGSDRSSCVESPSSEAVFQAAAQATATRTATPARGRNAWRLASWIEARKGLEEIKGRPWGIKAAGGSATSLFDTFSTRAPSHPRLSDLGPTEGSTWNLDAGPRKEVPRGTLRRGL